jgi:hypothetical protein
VQVTVMHSMQAGYMEKAQKYTDKALMQIEKLKSEKYSRVLFSILQTTSESVVVSFLNRFKCRRTNLVQNYKYCQIKTTKDIKYNDKHQLVLSV